MLPMLSKVLSQGKPGAITLCSFGVFLCCRRVIEKIDQSEFEGFEYVNPLLMSLEDCVWRREEVGVDEESEGADAGEGECRGERRLLSLCLPLRWGPQVRPGGELATTNLGASLTSLLWCWLHRFSKGFYSESLFYFLAIGSRRIWLFCYTPLESRLL